MIRIVVVGCGAVLEESHRGALQRLARPLDLAVVGLVDPNPGRLRKAREWFPGARGFTDLTSCFGELKDIALTIITSPPPFHAAGAEIAFSQGSHVLCEKPLAGSVPDAERIVAAAARHQRVLALGMKRRFYPCLIEARTRILAGQLGSHLTFTYREGGVYSWPIASPAPFRRQSSGGGVLLDTGVHALDFLGFLFGGGQVLEHHDDGTPEGVEANSITRLHFDRADGTLHLSWDMSLNNGLHIQGSEGECWMPMGPVDALFLRGDSSAEWIGQPIRAQWPLDLDPAKPKLGSPVESSETFVFQLVQTLRAVLLGESPAATGEDGLATMRLIAAAYEMALPMVKPWLSAPEQTAARGRHWRAARL